MKHIVHLIDDARAGGIRSLLDDMSAAQLRPSTHWRVLRVDPTAPIRLRSKCEVIVVHYSMAWRKLTALALLRIMNPRARLIIVEHHYTRNFEKFEVRSIRRFRSLLRLSYRLADTVVAVSQGQGEWLRDIHVINDNKLKVIPACRNYDRFLEIDRDPRERTTLRLGALGRLEPNKGFALLIDAVAGLPPDRYSLRIAGTGSEDKALQKRSVSLLNVELIGHLNDPVPFLAECDVLVVPSRMEAFGLVCSEAKASGIPVIVSNVDGLPEQAEEGGLVFNSGCVESLRFAIRLMTNSRARFSLGQRARDSVQSAWATFLSNWNELLN